MADAACTEALVIAQKIPDAKKRELLDSLSEDDFRDKVVRPLYRKRGLSHVRDTCGPDEQGKDCIFQTADPMGGTHIVAVQTKKGPVTMAGTTPNQNLVVIHAQLKMALETQIVINGDSTKQKPAQAHICASGKISNSAREHLFSTLESHRIKVFGADEIIEMIDTLFPEFWFGIDSDRFLYARELRKRLCTAGDVIRFSEILGSSGGDCPVLDGNYVPLRLARMDEKLVPRTKKTELQTGQTVRITESKLEPNFVDIPVESVLKQRHKLSLITGEGGSGKTTALRRIAMTMVDAVLSQKEDALFPIVLRATQLRTSNGPLLNVLGSEARSITNAGPSFSIDDVQNGKVVVLVDALEEVDNAERDRVLSMILDFHQLYPECRIVLTSRDYRSILDLNKIALFRHYWFLPIGIREANGLIEQAIQRKQIDRQVVTTTLRRLNENHGMTLSPMLVTVFLASADFTKQDLPPNLAEIFKKFTEQMIGRWDEKKGLHQQYEAGTKDFLLRQLTFHMHSNRTRSIARSKVERLFDSELSKRSLPLDRHKITEEIVDRSGLLRVTDDDVVEWRHHLLQEYFAGRGVPYAAFFESVVEDEWWRTPMIFYFGDKPESFADLHKIVESTTALKPVSLFDAAVTIGLAIQSCYLAETNDKVRTIAWVMESFARSMTEFRDSIDGLEGGSKQMMGLCTTLALGRDAIAARVIASVPKTIPTDTKNSKLFEALDPDRVEAWRIIGLLEARELDAAIEAIRTFRPKERDLTFMIHLSVAWVIYYQNPKGETKRRLNEYLSETVDIVDDLRQLLFKELRSLFFQMRTGKVASLLEAKSDNHAVAPSESE